MGNSPNLIAENAVWQAFVPWVCGNSSLGLQFTSHILHSGGFLLQWLPGGQFSFAQCFVKHWVLYELSYFRAVKYTSLKLLHAYLWELLLEEIKPTAFPFHCFHKVLHNSLTWYVSVEAVFCSVQHYASQVLSLDLMVTLFWHNVGHLPGCPRDTENKDTLCTHLGTLGMFQPPQDLHRSILVVNNRQQMIHSAVSFFHLYWMPYRDRWKTISIM